MAMRMIRHGEQIHWEQHGEDLTGYTDEELTTMLAARKAAVVAAREWTSTAHRALMATARKRKAVDGRTASNAGVEAVAIDVADPLVPADLRQMQQAYDQAQRDEANSKVALSAVRKEITRRERATAHAAIVAMHTARAEQRDAQRQAALRAHVEVAAAKPSILSRVRAAIGE